MSLINIHNLFLQYLISCLNGYFRKRSIIMSDQRVSAVNEIFNCIKLIKMYAWEDPFSLNLLGNILFIVNAVKYFIY